MKTTSVIRVEVKPRLSGKAVLVLLLLVSVLLSGHLRTAAAREVQARDQVDLAATKQIIRELGAASAWPGGPLLLPHRGRPRLR